MLLFLASAIAEQASTSTNLGFLTALSGLIAAIVAAGTFYMARRTTTQRESAAVKAVDADAYKRGVEIYESTIETLRNEVKDLRAEIRSLHDEISQLRRANDELARGIDNLRRESYNTLNRNIAGMRTEAKEAAEKEWPVHPDT